MALPNFSHDDFMALRPIGAAVQGDPGDETAADDEWLIRPITHPGGRAWMYRCVGGPADGENHFAVARSSQLNVAEQIASVDGNPCCIVHVYYVDPCDPHRMIWQGPML